MAVSLWSTLGVTFGTRCSMQGRFDSSADQELLRTCLIPKLLLPDVQSLRGTCRAFRSAIDSANPGVWTSVIRFSADCLGWPCCVCIHQLHSAVALRA